MKKLAVVSVSLLGVILLSAGMGCGKPKPTIITYYIPDGYVNTPYLQTLAASGGSGDYTGWSITDGNLPDGLSLDSSTGVISGTPTASDTFNFTIQVTDSNDATTSVATSINIWEPPSIITLALPDSVVNTAYSQAIDVSGGSGFFSWSVTSGALPGGLTLDSSAGVINGTPTSAGTFNFTVQTTDYNGVSATQALSINVAAVSS